MLEWSRWRDSYSFSNINSNYSDSSDSDINFKAGSILKVQHKKKTIKYVLLIITNLIDFSYGWLLQSCIGRYYLD